MVMQTKSATKAFTPHKPMIDIRSWATLPTSRLTWDANCRIFSGEIGDAPRGVIRPFAIGEYEQNGFIFESERTGRRLMMVKRVRRVKDGELKWVDYVPLHAAERRELGITVRLFNE